MAKTLEEMRKEIEGLASEWQKALIANDAAQMNDLENQMKSLEGEYAEEMRKDVFTECRNAEKPMTAAITRYSYEVIGHKVIREDGMVTGMEVTFRDKQIDLAKFAKFCDVPPLWTYMAEKFGNLMCMRAAKELGLTPAEVKKIEGLYYMNALAKTAEMGGVPTSNNQIVKLLQSIIDEVLKKEVGEKNPYRANSHDVAYLLMCYSKRSNRKILTVSVAKNSFVISLIMDIMHRLVTGKVYGIDYQMQKSDKKADEPKKATPAKVSEPETVKIERPEVSDEVSTELPEMNEIPEGAVA